MKYGGIGKGRGLEEREKWNKKQISQDARSEKGTGRPRLKTTTRRL